MQSNCYRGTLSFVWALRQVASGGRLDVGRTMAALPADLSVFKGNPNARLPYDASRAANALGFDPSVDPAVIDYQPTNPGGRLCLHRGASRLARSLRILCWLLRDCAALPLYIFSH